MTLMEKKKELKTLKSKTEITSLLRRKSNIYLLAIINVVIFLTLIYIGTNKTPTAFKARP